MKGMAWEIEQTLYLFVFFNQSNTHCQFWYSQIKEDIFTLSRLGKKFKGWEVNFEFLKSSIAIWYPFEIWYIFQGFEEW